MSQRTDDATRAGAVPSAPRLPSPDDEGREGLMAGVVDEIGSMMVEAKRTIAAAASRFDPDVPPTAFYVLRYVMKHQPCTAGDIVKAMAMDKSAVSRQVALLRDAGFVDVVADASDGRVSMLRSTERADARMLEVRHENRAVFRSHVEGWTDDELGEFAGWLRRFNTPPAGPR
ncbi:MarR family winged helix-turn-helix transcriptional regulator [Frigoribacterium faeni]|uniref:MarR family winged helix-turn-helix transcriptional regulator n=1 Tax=Frigoribacterium faeni TaxID=145483 RepID=UPI001FAB5F20|nr:helix-turn-helix domain-containing protein [Frigoribacterium faeni]MCJ0701956.1 MarR family winged helix-turn-helix transcriptional regulator [Frigoribacterium faeni]